MSCFSHTSNKGDARRGLTPGQRARLRYSVRSYRYVAPNAHLGDDTPREDIRHAFFLVRNAWTRFGSLEAAIGQLDQRAYLLSEC
jgi:hypothetical protein